ncbi:pectate lyase-like adhesive domain-containing protein [Bacillus cytotoxicus]
MQIIKKFGILFLVGGIFFTQTSVLDYIPNKVYAATNEKQGTFSVGIDKKNIKVNENVVLKITNKNKEDSRIELALSDGQVFNDEETNKLNEKNKTAQVIYLPEQRIIQISKKEKSDDIGDVSLVIQMKKVGEYTFAPIVKSKGQDKKVKATVLRVEEQEKQLSDFKEKRIFTQQQNESPEDNRSTKEMKNKVKQKEVEKAEQIESKAKAPEKSEEQTNVTKQENLQLDENKKHETKQAPENADYIANVYDEKTWHAAWDNPKIQVINITQDFYTMDHINSGAVTFKNYYNQVNRELTIKGNGHTIDAGSESISLYGINCKIRVENLNIYHRNWYGFITTAFGANNSEITFHNVKDTGAQMLHSFNSKLILSGNIENNEVGSYTSPINGYTYNVVNSSNGDGTDGIAVRGQANWEVADVTVKEGSKIKANGYSTVSNFAIQNGGNVQIEKDVSILFDNSASENHTDTDASPSIFFYGAGSLTLGENSHMNIINGPGRAYRPSAISMANNSKISIKKNAVLDIEIQKDEVGYGRNESPIYMEGNSQFFVDDGGSFHLNVKGTNAGSAPAIVNMGAGTFKVGKNGTFTVISDMTSPNYGLIYMGNGSTFQFSDAKKIDLQLTNPNSPSALIQMPSGEWKVDVQRVYQWNKGNITQSPDYKWTPIFGMAIPYVNTTVGNIRAQSVNEDMLRDFKQHFNSAKAQRIVFDHIPDCNVKITNQPSDNPKDENSYIVVGKTIPNAYVRLSGSSFTEKDHTIKSPVQGEDIPKEISDNFTVKADSEGNFKYTISPTRHFVAGDKIVAFAFNEGKYSEYSVEVLDTTPPVGTGEKIETALNDTTVPALSNFIKEESDTNPNNKKINYLWSDKNTSDLQTMLKQEGTHEVYIVLEDDNGNTSQPIKSELVVHATAGEIHATDIKARINDIQSMSREEFRQFLLDESHVKAWYVADFKYHDGEKDVQIRNFDQIKQEKGSYIVELFLSKDLTKQREDIVKKINLTIDEGNLELIAAPEKISFENITIPSREKIVNRSSMQGEIVVSDQRQHKNEWKIYVKQVKPLTSLENDVISDGFVYSKDGQDIVLSDQNSLVYHHKSEDDQNVHINWKDSEGIRLKVKPGPNVKVNETYQGELEWTLTDAPM